MTCYCGAIATREIRWLRSDVHFSDACCEKHAGQAASELRGTIHPIEVLEVAEDD